MEIEAIHNEAEDLKNVQNSATAIATIRWMLWRSNYAKLRTCLKAVYVKNTRKLGLWGFDATDLSKGKLPTKQ